MKFNNIVGNPPYTNDIHLKFLLNLRNSYTDNMSMIIPAKWQAKDNEQNNEFRKLATPHMKEIVFYPDCGDIFLIGDVGGISYFISDTEVHNKKHIKTICKTNKNINSQVYRELNNTLSCYADSIIEKVNNLKEPKIKLDKLTKLNNFNYMITTPPAIGGTKGAESFLLSKTGMLQCIKIGKTCTIEETQNLSSSYKVLCSANTETELQYKWSYINSRLVRFLVLAGLCTQSILTPETWRYVPEQFEYNHIFTDQELYEKYKLTMEEINIIESVIKERK